MDRSNTITNNVKVIIIILIMIIAIIMNKYEHYYEIYDFKRNHDHTEHQVLLR